ncbi:hypothetical protein D3C79_973100 [compost metagenome]
MHGVGADQQKIRATGLQIPGSDTQQASGGGPVTGVLQPFYLGEVDAVEQHPRRVQAAEPGPHAPVERLIVADAGLPAHASQQTDTFHGNSLVRRVTVIGIKKAPQGQQDRRVGVDT